MSPDFPLISHAQVVGVNPATGYLQVAYPSIMGSAFPVRILHHGPADGLRVGQMPMPGIGTWGIVCAPYGDSRNAIWLGAYYTTGIDARTGDGDPYTKYHSHWSGAFEHMDGSGNEHTYYPDGTYTAFASSTALPAITRHTVNAAQKRIATSFPATGRTASAVAARPVLLHHASGTEVSITAAGTAMTSVAAGQSNILTGNGATVEITATGSITAVAEPGQIISLMANGTVFTIDSSGNVNIALASGAHFSIGNGGSDADTLVLAQLMAYYFNTHTHSGVETGGGNTGTPTTPITAAEISSSIFQVQS
jgi:hypothetical protein